MSKQYIMIGLGGHATVLLDILALHEARCIGYVEKVNRDKSLRYHLEYLGTDEFFLESKRYQHINLINGIATIRSCALHKAIYMKYKAAGFQFAQLFHPSAVISRSAILAEGMQVCAQATIQAYAHIGENVIVNTSAIVEHDVVIGKHTHIAPGATICGSAVIGEEVIIGAGAVILPGVQIASHSIIGAAALIHRDIEVPGIYVGNPYHQLCDLN